VRNTYPSAVRVFSSARQVLGDPDRQSGGVADGGQFGRLIEKEMSMSLE
jgi:hypothetical protein